ncbi:MAG: hypothetical protein CSA55_04325 [Ilumatobacter coccineus]|uniref:Ribosome maturation factor RimP n=1 Tax=Ilumatobacter coccineus TaxID=467094 RepID=A0A2G6KB24_9ACTN|nr:MAG: hypothetical protein CSA55_04325 [Ilumatobacter coccineus]
MTRDTISSPVLTRVATIVDPIASDLGLDVYDLEQRGGTIRVTLDTPPGSDSGISLDQIALATRLISRQLDHDDPIPGRYTLEVTSPGLERALRRPEHFQRELGKEIKVRLSNVESDQRRVRGILVAADDLTATIRVTDGEDTTDRVIDLSSVDRAHTVFEWGPQPKPGSRGKKSGKKAARKPAKKSASAADSTSSTQSTATKESS